MTIGKKYVVILNENGSGTAVINSVDFTGTFSYNGAYTSNVVVLIDDISGNIHDRFIVTYYWAAAEGPDLATVTVAALLADAVIQVNTALPGSIV